jgi:hypothetical protein
MVATRREELTAKQAFPNMKPGQRYKVHSMIPGVERVMRESIMEFLEYGDESHRRSLFFNLRPLAGTQEIDFLHVHAMWETDAPLALPGKIRTETRVY